MGSWSVYCSISNIQICVGQEIVFLPLKRSNKNEYLTYLPATLPIFGIYNDYGSIINIIKDDNINLISKHFEIPIEKFIEIIIFGHHSNDDPKHIKNYDEFKDWQYMFIDRKVYEYMIKIHHYGHDGKGHISLGTDAILKEIGFEYVGEREGRYNKVYKYNDIAVYSNGRSLIGDNNKYFTTLNYNEYSLSSIIDIPKDKLWLGEKAQHELWRYEDIDYAKKKLGYLIGYSSNIYNYERVFDKLLPISCKLHESYVNNLDQFGDRLAQLISIKNNIFTISKTFEPLKKYITPQCSEHYYAQNIFDTFAKINKSYINEED